MNKEQELLKLQKQFKEFIDKMIPFILIFYGDTVKLNLHLWDDPEYPDDLLLIIDDSVNILISDEKVKDELLVMVDCGNIQKGEPLKRGDIELSTIDEIVNYFK